MQLGEKPIPPLDIDLPLGISRISGTMPGNIILVSGSQNAGKTTFMLTALYTLLKKEKERTKEKEKTNNNTPESGQENLIHRLVANGIQYQNSEMSSSELTDQLHRLTSDLSLFSDSSVVQFVERTSDWADIIIPDGINFIDYLEIVEDYWMIGQKINEIHKELNDGICFIACQKKPGADYAKGGFQSLEKPRLAINLDMNGKYGCICKMTKCKNPKNKKRMDGKELDYGIDFEIGRF